MENIQKENTGVRDRVQKDNISKGNTNKGIDELIAIEE